MRVYFPIDGLLYIIIMVMVIMIIMPCDCSLTWKSILNVHLLTVPDFNLPIPVMPFGDGLAVVGGVGEKVTTKPVSSCKEWIEMFFHNKAQSLQGLT